VDFPLPEAIRAEVSGFVEEVFAKERDILAPGAPVVRLRKREVEQRYYSAKQRVEIADLMIQRAMDLDRPDELQPARSSKAQFQAAFAEASKDREHLILRTATGGIVLTRDLHNAVGGYLKSGELFCEVAVPEAMSVRIPLTEKQVRYVKKGQHVALKAAAYPGRTLHGTVADDPLMFVGNNLPAAVSGRRSGDVPTGLDREGREVPLEVTYEARVAVENPDGSLRQGMTGRAKIDAGRRLYGRSVLQSLLDLVSLDYRF